MSGGGSNVRVWKRAKALSMGAFLVALVASTAQAESAEASSCKGLEQKACVAKADCSWVSATTRKDGRKVKAYCRTKPKQSTSTTNAPKS